MLEASVLFGILLLIVATLWFLLWKFVLEPNPLVRDFFDLDKKPKRTIRKVA
ncbi:DUF4750 domain-containing protein [archaeon]|nr:MAG: DUF4750 domain-containing protein [archaeon]